LLYALAAIVVNIAKTAGIVARYGGSFTDSLSVSRGPTPAPGTKYLLDKAYIFRYTTRDKSHEVRTFALYTIMGLATTTVFWGTEALFHFWWRSDVMRYLGGVLGLAIGYVAKYYLDKRYVFR